MKFQSMTNDLGGKGNSIRKGIGERSRNHASGMVVDEAFSEEVKIELGLAWIT